MAKTTKGNKKGKTGIVSSRKLKLACKELYLNNTEPSAIVNLLPVPLSTLYSWINSEGWKEQRNSSLQTYINTPEILLKSLMIVINSLHEDKSADEIAKISDSVSKISKTIKDLCKTKDYLSQILFAVKELGTYMNEQNDYDLYDEAFREKLTALLSGFQIKSLEKYSNDN